MGDENNIANEEETAALFVSGQKKIKAEEEAKRQAAEEEERRLAAEAKARQDEADLAERRKKAEKEELKLAKKAERKAAKKKNKLPLFIGLGVVAVIIIFFIAASTSDSNSESNTNKGGVDYASLEANAEYKPNSGGNNIKLVYPDGLYRNVTENSLNDNSVQVVFDPEEEGGVVTNVVITPLMIGEEGKTLTVDAVSFTEMDDIIAALEKISNSMLEEINPGAAITDVKLSEISNDKPDKYFYSCNFSSENYKTGAGYSWIERNEDGEYRAVVLSCADKQEDTEKVNIIKDLFVKNNAENSFGMVGANTPTSTDDESLLEDTTIHMGLHTPKNLFAKYDAAGDVSVWTDENGAIIILQPTATTENLNDSSLQYDYEKVYQFLKENIAKDGAMEIFDNVASRETLSESEFEGKAHYSAEYKDTIDGILYWERVYTGWWRDARTSQCYWYRILTIAPYKDMEVYKKICTNMESKREDI